MRCVLCFVVIVFFVVFHIRESVCLRMNDFYRQLQTNRAGYQATINTHRGHNDYFTAIYTDIFFVRNFKRFVRCCQQRLKSFDFDWLLNEHACVCVSVIGREMAR